MELTLYIKPWCPWCVEAVAWLEDQGYQFNTIEVTDRSPSPMSACAAYPDNHSLRHWKPPDGHILPDFDVAQLEKFMLNHALLP